MMHILRWQHFNNSKSGCCACWSYFHVCRYEKWCLQDCNPHYFVKANTALVLQQALGKYICHKETMGFLAVRKAARFLLFLGESIQIYTVLGWPFVYLLPPGQNTVPRISMQNETHVHFPHTDIFVFYSCTSPSQYREINRSIYTFPENC